MTTFEPAVKLLNIHLDNLSLDETLSRIQELIAGKQGVYIVTPNIDHLVKLQHDAEFLEIYQRAALRLADGMPLLWAARYLQTPLKAKISGSDLFPRLCELAAHKGYKLFFLGGRLGAADKSAVLFKQKHPEIQIVGTYCPPFGFELNETEQKKIIGLITAAKPDLLFVGLGAPKQEKWIYKYHKQLGVPVSMGIGVSFEFVSGMVKRAPRWMQRSGLEWLWRLMMEPHRLWKRYLMDDPEFIRLVMKQKQGYYKQP